LKNMPVLLADGGEFDFLLSAPKINRELLIGKSGATETDIKRHLEYILEKGTSREVVWPYAEEMGKGKVLWPMRVALSGKEKSPDPFTLVQMLGEDESRARIKATIDLLS
jgi:glutamyl/glutaminyl-tRNA synthetase